MPSGKRLLCQLRPNQQAQLAQSGRSPCHTRPAERAKAHLPGRATCRQTG